MRPLTLDDLLPLNEYAGRRGEFFDSITRYRDRYRRVRIGPRLTLCFENRQTLWFHVQELIRVARLAEPARVQEELDLYNRLLPNRDQLQAALLIEIADERRLTEELAFWQTMTGDQLRLRVGEYACPANIVTARPEDRCIGAANWVEFSLDDSGRRTLADFHLSARFEVLHPDYRHESPLLNDDIRQSLLDDLELSDRD